MSGLNRLTESHPNEESAEKKSEDVCEENKQTETDDSKIIIDPGDMSSETKVATRSVGSQYDPLDISLESVFESVEFPSEDDFMTNLIQEFKRLLSKRPLIEEIRAYTILNTAERSTLNYNYRGNSLNNDQIFCIGVLDIVDTFPKEMREETVASMLQWLFYILHLYSVTSIDDNNEDTEQNLD